MQLPEPFLWLVRAHQHPSCSPRVHSDPELTIQNDSSNRDATRNRHPPDRSAILPPTGPLGDPPTHLTPYQKAIWHELVSLIPPGVAGNSDRIHVELTVRLIAKLRRGVAKVSESAQLIICLSRLGMTPADRSKVSAVPQSEQLTQANPEDEFIQ